MKNFLSIGLSGMLIGLLGLSAPALAAKCPKDSVLVANVCVDLYEASVWEIPVTNKALIKKVKKGVATLASLTAAGGIQRGAASDDYGSGCPDTGNGCTDFYAASILGVTPARFLTWFQATAACRNAGKRLLTNAEWQMAALGTPDGAPCIVNAGGPGVTGTPGCESDVGVFDMVGNLWEWVADWIPAATGCSSALLGTGDFNCMTIDPTAGSTPSGPAALIRGGDFSNNTNAGVFAVYGTVQPSLTGSNFGFRCGR